MMKRSKRLILALLLAGVGLVGQAGAGSTPTQINYQGVLHDSLGVPYPPGSYIADFRLWTAPVGGAILLWGERIPFTVSTGGAFNVMFNAAHEPQSAATPPTPLYSISQLDLACAYTNMVYLGITVVYTPSGWSPASPELQRQQLVSVAYALRAENAYWATSIGGSSNLVDIRGLDRAHVPSGGRRMVGLSNNVAVYLPATEAAGTLTVETNLMVDGTLYTATNGLFTDCIRAPSGPLGVYGNVSMFPTQWTNVTVSGGSTPWHTAVGDGWLIVEMPFFTNAPSSQHYRTYLETSTETGLLFDVVTQVIHQERCVTRSIPAGTSWRVNLDFTWPNPPRIWYQGALR